MAAPQDVPRPTARCRLRPAACAADRWSGSAGRPARAAMRPRTSRRPVRRSVQLQRRAATRRRCRSAGPPRLRGRRRALAVRQSGRSVHSVFASSTAAFAAQNCRRWRIGSWHDPDSTHRQQRPRAAGRRAARHPPGHPHHRPAADRTRDRHAAGRPAARLAVRRRRTARPPHRRNGHRRARCRPEGQRLARRPAAHHPRRRRHPAPHRPAAPVDCRWSPTPSSTGSSPSASRRPHPPGRQDRPGRAHRVAAEPHRRRRHHGPRPARRTGSATRSPPTANPSSRPSRNGRTPSGTSPTAGTTTAACSAGSGWPPRTPKRSSPPWNRSPDATGSSTPAPPDNAAPTPSSSSPSRSCGTASSATPAACARS